MSETRGVSMRSVASPIEDLTMIVVLRVAEDGWRVYEAACVMRPGEHWEGDRIVAIAYARQYGKKLDRDHARRYFYIPDDMRFVR